MIIVISPLKNISIKRILKKASISIVPSVLSIVNKYTIVSYTAVVPITIKQTINLLSFEKFLLSISPSRPTIPRANADVPIVLPSTMSKYNPNPIPHASPIFLFTNRPIIVLK